MNLIELQKKFNTHKKCINHLQKVRWAGKAQCPHCESRKSTLRGKSKRKIYKTPKYHCNSCNKDFTVLFGTIFEGSKLPLQKWYMLISLMLNARKGISAKQISRDIDLTYKTAWYSAMRVRCAMLDQADMLEGIIEADEVYIGGKPRKRYKLNSDNEAVLSTLTTKRGRGTDKIPVVGFVEREGQKRVVTKMADSLTGDDLLKMLKRYVKQDNAILMTDEYRGYRQFDKVVQHLTVNHSLKEYVKDGVIHTNTIEGFWSIIKNGIRGQYHVLSKKYLPFYLAEFAYKYNRRSKEQEEVFNETITNAVAEEKCEVNYKPKAYPKFLAYKRRKKKKQRGKKTERVQPIKDKKTKTAK